MNETDAKAALRAQGIRNPSNQLVEDYIRVQQAQDWALEVPERNSVQVAGTAPMEALPNSAPERTERPHPSSESNLEPTLRERGELDRPAGPRKPGRPPIIAPWFEALARVMSDGTSLRAALAICGIHGLSEREIRALYRNRALIAMRREARQKRLSGYGFRRRTRRNRCRGQ